MKTNQMPMPKMNPLEQHQRQQEQQQFSQNERNRITSEKMLEEVLHINDLLSATQWTKLKQLIEVQFALQPANRFRIRHEDFLELYERIYEQDEAKFNLIELGIISDMFYIDMPLREGFDMQIKDWLILKVEMRILPKTFSERMEKISSETEIELKNIMNKKIVKPNFGG